MSLPVDASHCELPPAWLSRSEEKRQLYAIDTYFTESWEDAKRILGTDLKQVLHTSCAAVLKPDIVAARRLERAAKWFEDNGFRSVAARQFRFDRNSVRAMWCYHWNAVRRPHKDVMDRFLASGDSLVVFLRSSMTGHEPATVRLTALKGPADPSRRQPGQLREILGAQTMLLNYIHTADEPADLVREIGVLFPRQQREDLYKELRGGMRASLEPHITTLHSLQPQRSLDVKPILERLGRAASEDGDPRAGRTALAQALATAGTLDCDWRTVSCLARKCGERLSEWDDIMLGTHLTVSELSDVERILPAVQRGEWAPATGGEEGRAVSAHHHQAVGETATERWHFQDGVRSGVEASWTRHGRAVPGWLSRSPQKLAWYSADTWFIEAWEDIEEECRGETPDWAWKHAALVLKPDAVAGRRLLPALEWLAQEGFDVVASRIVSFDRHVTRAVWRYQWNVATRGRKELVDKLLTATPSLYLLVRNRTGEGESASAAVSRRKGSATPADQRPGQLRHYLGGRSPLLNFVHTTDEPADLVREMGIFFTGAQRRELLAASRESGSTCADAEARELARQLEKAAPCSDLDVDAAFRRLRLASGQAEDEIRQRFRDKAWEIGAVSIGPDEEWDAIVISTHTVAMNIEGLEPLLAGVTSAASGTGR